MELTGTFSECNWVDGSKYECGINVLGSLAIMERDTEIRAVHGVHLPRKRNKDVTAMTFNYRVVKYVPKGLPKIFSKLRSFQILHGGLKEISSLDLVEFGNLVSLSLPQNQLKTIPTNLLDNMKQLKFLFFTDNKIEFVSSKLLSKLAHQLLKVDFRQNTSIDAFYDSSPTEKGSVGTVKELMDVIDMNCLPPIEDASNPEFGVKLKDGFKAMWKSGDLTDFVIEVDKEEFRVHKTVLAVQSSVLNGVFRNDLEESKTNRMKIVDFSAESVGEFLNFLYSGELESKTNAMELFKLGHMYDVPRLQMASKNIIIEHLDKSNAIDVLDLANLYETSDLIWRAFQKIGNLFPGLVLSKNLMNEPKAVRKLIDAKRLKDQADVDYEKLLKGLKVKKLCEVDL